MTSTMPGISTIPGSAQLQNVTSGQPIVNQASTNYLWAQMVLQDAGLPTTQSNLNAMVLWMQAEEPPSDWFNRNNPLNASLGTSASDGTGSYPSLTVAAQQTAAMIRQKNMASIYNAFSSGTASPATIGAGIIASPWASSHYGGNLAKFTGTPPAVIAAGTGAVLGAGAAASGSSAGGTGVGCNAKGGGIDILGAHIGDACQIKALTGALLIGIGGGVLLVGATLIAAYGLSQTRIGKAGLAAASGTPVGRVASVAAGAPSRARRAPARAAAPAPRRVAAPAPATEPGYTESDVDTAYESGRATGATEGPSESTRQRWRREGFSGEGAARKGAKPGIAGA